MCEWMNKWSGETLIVINDKITPWLCIVCEIIDPLETPHFRFEIFTWSISLFWSSLASYDCCGCTDGLALTRSPSVVHCEVGIYSGVSAKSMILKAIQPVHVSKLAYFLRFWAFQLLYVMYIGKQLDFQRKWYLFNRIRTERLGGAWCPKQPISRDAYEWLEIDLQELKAITQVETQGRFGNGQVSWREAGSAVKSPGRSVFSSQGCIWMPGWWQGVYIDFTR